MTSFSSCVHMVVPMCAHLWCLIFSSYKGTSHVELESSPMTLFTVNYHFEILMSKYNNSEILRIGDSTCELWGDTVQPIIPLFQFELLVFFERDMDFAVILCLLMNSKCTLCSIADTLGYSSLMLLLRFRNGGSYMK